MCLVTRRWKTFTSFELSAVYRSSRGHPTPFLGVEGSFPAETGGPLPLAETREPPSFTLGLDGESAALPPIASEVRPIILVSDSSDLPNKSSGFRDGRDRGPRRMRGREAVGRLFLAGTPLVDTLLPRDTFCQGWVRLTGTGGTAPPGTFR